jgi:NtrC-family two-component system sensor histidine kinase KinB
VRFDELKNDLVATVAHEFRTPLTSLRMAIHMCAE